MYTVEIYGRVRRAVLVEGQSRRSVAREFGVSRKTIQKMLTYSVPPDYQRQLPTRRPKLGPARSNPSRCRQRRRFPVKQRHGIHQGALVEVSIPGGHGDRAVAGSHLHNLEVHALLNEPANKGVS